MQQPLLVAQIRGWHLSLESNSVISIDLKEKNNASKGTSVEALWLKICRYTSLECFVWTMFLHLYSQTQSQKCQIIQEVASDLRLPIMWLFDRFSYFTTTSRPYYRLVPLFGVHTAPSTVAFCKNTESAEPMDASNKSTCQSYKKYHSKMFLFIPWP